MKSPLRFNLKSKTRKHLEHSPEIIKAKELKQEVVTHITKRISKLESMRSKAVHDKEMYKQKRAIIRYLKEEERKRKEEQEREKLIIKSTIKIQTIARMFLAKRKLHELKIERDSA